LFYVSHLLLRPVLFFAFVFWKMVQS
jgi:hypothetical protein